MDKNYSIKIKEQMVSALGSVVRGENLENKRVFMQKQGIDIITQLIHEIPNSNRIREKGLNILIDILVYSDKLKEKYPDLPVFD